LNPSSPQWAETVAAKLEAIREDASKFPEIKRMADHVTFAEEPGGLGKGLEDLRRRSPFVMNIVTPFIRTPYNIASRAVDISPLGPVRTLAEVATGRGRGTDDLGRRLRDNALGLGMAYMAYSLAEQDALTGKGPDDPEKVAELRATGWQPYSIRLNNPLSGKPEYWSYANFAPFSLALSMGAAASEARKYAKPEKTDTLSMLADAAERSVAVVTDMTVLAGIGAVVKSIQDPDRYGGQWLSQFLGSLVPAGSLLNTVGQMQDPNIRRADRDTFANQVAGGVLVRIPENPLTPDRMDVPVAQDPLGRPIPNDQQGAAALNPFRPTTERPDPVLQVFLDAQVDIGKPKDKLGLRQGASIEMTPPEQRRWNTARGAAIQEIVRAEVLNNPDYRTASPIEKQATLRRVLAGASERADQQLRGAIGETEILRRLGPSGRPR